MNKYLVIQTHDGYHMIEESNDNYQECMNLYKPITIFFDEEMAKEFISYKTYKDYLDEILSDEQYRT